MALQGCSEWEAFQAVRLWAAGGAEQAEVERLLPLVRFPFMSPQELQVRPTCKPPQPGKDSGDYSTLRLDVFMSGLLHICFIDLAWCQACFGLRLHSVSGASSDVTCRL